MKKILALLLACSMLFAFAACGGNTDAETTTAAPEETTVAEETTAVEETTMASEETTVAEETTAAEETTVAEETTGAALSTTEEIVAFYNAAVVKTDEAGPTEGASQMKLSGDITGDGVIGAILSVLTPAAEKALAKNSTPTDDIPGRGTLKASDVKSATATSSNGKITIKIVLKDQTDGPDGDPENGGPVARGIGTLGSIESALKELGATLESGRDTVKLTYTDAYINCTVDEETGMVTGGTWHHLVKIHVGDAKAKLGLSARLKNLKGAVEYVVNI